jgi:eukaryotic-like serine/threonine-protein kinase
MADEPPIALVDLLAKLHVATPEQVREVQGRARRLARDLPLFDSVWIDALAQVRLLTPFQAGEINAGRGEQLLVGPYVLRRRMQRTGYADSFLAAAIDGEVKTKKKSKPIVQLVVARGMESAQGADAAAAQQSMAARFASATRKGVVTIRAAGFSDGVLWAAYDRPVGIAANEWLSCHGRFSPASALEIARQMVAALAALEKDQILHGDISASALWLNDAGQVQLARCGMRGTARFTGDLTDGLYAPDMVDYLAPELICGDKASPTVVSEIYSCGMLWWHLLAGRPPLGGGNLEGKLQAMREAKVPDIRWIAPDVAGTSASAIERCTQRDPALRPQSFAELEQMIGSPTGAGRRLVAIELFRSGVRTSGADLPSRIRSAVQGTGQPLLAATACAILLCAATWPLWRSRHPVIDSAKTTSVAASADVQRVPTGPTGLAIFERRGSVKVSHASDAPHKDREIRPASFASHDETAGTNDQRSTSAASRPVIELTSGAEIAGSTLRLTAGTIVRGKEGERPRVAMPANGLVITVENVRFENIDFVWRHKPEEITSPERHAFVELHGGQTEFAGCTFQAQPVGSFELPAAIRLGNHRQRGGALSPAIRVELDRCVIQGAACCMDCAARGPAAMTARNTLFLGPGSLVRFPEARHADAATSVVLEHVTMRGGAAMIELHCDDPAEWNGTVTVSTTGCVFAPDESGALVLIDGKKLPKVTGGALAALDWSCQDSLASPGAPITQWRHGETHETLPDDELALEGLVASAFDFVGDAGGDPGSSRLRRWLAPMRTELTPGIDENLPPLPEPRP